MEKIDEVLFDLNFIGVLLSPTATILRILSIFYQNYAP